MSRSNQAFLSINGKMPIPSDSVSYLDLKDLFRLRAASRPACNSINTIIARLNAPAVEPLSTVEDNNEEVLPLEIKQESKETLPEFKVEAKSELAKPVDAAVTILKKIHGYKNLSSQNQQDLLASRKKLKLKINELIVQLIKTRNLSALTFLLPHLTKEIIFDPIVRTIDHQEYYAGPFRVALDEKIQTEKSKQNSKKSIEVSTQISNLLIQRAGHLIALPNEYSNDFGYFNLFNIVQACSDPCLLKGILGLIGHQPVLSCYIPENGGGPILRQAILLKLPLEIIFVLVEAGAHLQQDFFDVFTLVRERIEKGEESEIVEIIENQENQEENELVEMLESEESGGKTEKFGKAKKIVQPKTRGELLLEIFSGEKTYSIEAYPFPFPEIKKCTDAMIHSFIEEFKEFLKTKYRGWYHHGLYYIRTNVKELSEQLTTIQDTYSSPRFNKIRALANCISKRLIDPGIQEFFADRIFSQSISEEQLNTIILKKYEVPAKPEVLSAGPGPGLNP